MTSFRHFLVLCVAAGLALPAVAQRPMPVFLDTDIGDDIDDALALSLALQSPELDIRGVSTVLQDGPGRAALVSKILALYGRTGVPIGIGAEQPLLAKPRTGVVVQTRALEGADRASETARQNGLELLVDTCLRSPEKITVIAYGPLTNIALALRAEPRLRDHIERIVLMNGVFFHAGLEYNTKMDPEAAEIVYNAGVPVLAVGLDVTLQCRLRDADLQKFADSKEPSVVFLWKLIQLWQGANPHQNPVLHDPLSIMAAIRPALIRTVHGAVAVETNGTPEQSYGLSVFHRDPSANVDVAQEVDSGAVVDFFLSRVLSPPRTNPSR